MQGATGGWEEGMAGGGEPEERGRGGTARGEEGRAVASCHSTDTDHTGLLGSHSDKVKTCTTDMIQQ